MSYEKILQKSRFLGLCRNARSNVTRSTFVRRRSFSLSYEKILQKSRFLGLCRNARSNVTRSTFVRRRSFSLSYEKIFQKSRFWVFSVIQRQISLGVPTVRRRLFSLSYEKILQKSRVWVFSLTLRQISSEYIRTPSFIFLVLRKNSSKIEILGLFVDTASNFTRNIFVRRRLFSLSYEKILQKSRLWVFYVIQRQISIGVHSYAVVHFPCLTKKSFKNRDLGLFGNTASNFARSTFARRRSFSDGATKCVTCFTFNTNFNLCHSSG